jgi:hypothetical protein
MGWLIDDLLRLSRLSRVPLTCEPIDLTAMARDACAELAAQEPTRVVTVRVAEGLVAFGDPGLVRVVLEQLLGNAWKFTAKTPDAHIDVGRVSDEGRGGDLKPGSSSVTTGRGSTRSTDTSCSVPSSDCTPMRSSRARGSGWQP